MEWGGGYDWREWTMFDLWLVEATPAVITERPGGGAGGGRGGRRGRGGGGGGCAGLSRGAESNAAGRPTYKRRHKPHWAASSRADWT